MKQLYFIVFFALLPIGLVAQENGVEQEVKNYQESRSQLISKGRRLLMDKFLEGDIVKVKEVKDYLLTEVQTEDYIALYPWEQWLIMYWTGEHEGMAEKIIQVNDQTVATYQRKILPERDLLYAKLIEKSWDQLEVLEEKILASSLDLPAKDFLLLHLNSQVSGEPLLKISQEEVNKMADIYLETHTNSAYNEYIKNYIRYRYAPSDWALGMDFSVGYGVLTGELSQMYNNLGIFGFGLDVEYKKFTLYLRLHAGFAKTLQDRENNGVFWEKGSEASFFNPDASIGYAVLENDRLKLSPYVGIGGASFGPTTTEEEERPDLEELKVGFSPAYTVGLNVNIKLGWETAPYLTMVEDKSYWFVRIRYGYTMPQFSGFPMHNGNVHQVTIGFGGLYRGMKRVI